MRSGSRPSARPWWEDPVRLALYRIETRQLQIAAKLNLIFKMEQIQMAFADDLEERITNIEGAGDSTIALLTEIHREMTEAQGDPARQQAALDRLDALKDKLAAAVAANPDPNP